MRSTCGGGAASSAATMRSAISRAARADLLLEPERDVRLEVAVLAVASRARPRAPSAPGSPAAASAARRAREIVDDHRHRRTTERRTSAGGSAAAISGTTWGPLGRTGGGEEHHGAWSSGTPFAGQHRTSALSLPAHSAASCARTRSVATNVQIRAVPPGSETFGAARHGTTHVGRGRKHVRRQGGLGRGLAELLPDATDPEPHPVEHHFPPIPGSEPPRSTDGARDETRSRTSRKSRTTDTTGAGSSGDEETDVADLGTELVAELATDQSGLAIIYRGARRAGRAVRAARRRGRHRRVRASAARSSGPARKPLDDPGGEALLDAEPGPLHRPAARGRGGRRVARSPASASSPCGWRCSATTRGTTRSPGSFDRRSFDRLLEMSVARSLRYHWPFTPGRHRPRRAQAINDAQGHAAGDAALQALGERFRRVLRFGDNAARIGGDEFAVILPNTDPDDVPMLLERIGSSPARRAPVPAVLVRRRAVPGRGGRHRRACSSSPTPGSTKPRRRRR